MDPVPPSPAPPSALPPPPPRNWWQRNWKWFVPTGCLTFMALVAAFVVMIALIFFSAMKSSDAYKMAVARAKADPRVIQSLGTPISEGLFLSGSTNVNGASGEADLAIPISGPKAKATVYAVATKFGGKWTYSRLIVQVPGRDEIDLLEETEPAR